MALETKLEEVENLIETLNGAKAVVEKDNKKLLVELLKLKGELKGAKKVNLLTEK